MKKILVLSVLFLINFVAHSQVYQIMKSTSLYKIDEKAKAKLSNDLITKMYSAKTSSDTNSVNNVNYKMQFVKKGYLFELTDEIGDYYVLSILKFSKNDELNNQLFNSNFKKDTIGIPNLFFIIKKSQLKNDFEENTSRLGFGSLILPIKVRFGGQKDGQKIYTKFESGVNLGVALTYRFNKKLKEVDVYGLLSLSTSQVNLDAESTNNFITSSQDASAITPSLGLLFQFKNNLQIIAIAGLDVISGKIGRNWLYRDRPFIGIGLGFNIAQLGVKPEKNE